MRRTAVRKPTAEQTKWAVDCLRRMSPSIVQGEALAQCAAWLEQECGNMAEVGKTVCRHGIPYDGPDCDRCEADEAAWKPTGNQEKP